MPQPVFHTVDEEIFFGLSEDHMIVDVRANPIRDVLLYFRKSKPLLSPVSIRRQPRSSRLCGFVGVSHAKVQLLKTEDYQVVRQEVA
jgi:hypothetical protein